MADIKELYDKMVNSSESKIKHKIWMFKNNFCICDGNFNDLQKFYNRINAQDFMCELKTMPDRQKHIELINLDMLRRISNYLSSAFSLVGYARDYMKENYSDTETLQVYEKYIKENFIDNNLTKFIQDLRNFFLHNGINGFSYSLSAIGPNVNDVKFSTTIQKRNLNKGSYFTTKSKEYMLTLPESIDIMVEIQKYHKLVLELYTWLFGYLNDLHKEDISKAKKYEQEYFDEMARLFYKQK